jgi:hypothetical protein
MADDFDGNKAQNRKIAEQLFSVWAESEKRISPPRLMGSLPAWIACVLSICLLIWNAAVISGSVAQNTRRIDQIEANERQSDGDNRQMIDRMARIEAKVDIIIAEKKL